MLVTCCQFLDILQQLLHFSYPGTSQNGGEERDELQKTASLHFISPLGFYAANSKKNGKKQNRSGKHGQRLQQSGVPP